MSHRDTEPGVDTACSADAGSPIRGNPREETTSLVGGVTAKRPDRGEGPRAARLTPPPHSETPRTSIRWRESIH